MPVGCGRSSVHRGRQRPPHGGKRFWYVWAAAALRRGRVSNAVVAATAAALEALSTTGSSSFVQTGADAVRHAIRGAAGNQVAWRVPTHAVELRPGGERLAHVFTLSSASGVAPPHPSLGRPSCRCKGGTRATSDRAPRGQRRTAKPTTIPGYNPAATTTITNPAAARRTTRDYLQYHTQPAPPALQHQNQHQQLNHALHCQSLHHRPTTLPSTTSIDTTAPGLQGQRPGSSPGR